ncbi:MAG: helical backbone metal receptor [Gemmatimonadetes bacterium]|nr:helical backbone metal receptor [Gemmatimonadota bacterium]
MFPSQRRSLAAVSFALALVLGCERAPEPVRAGTTAARAAAKDDFGDTIASGVPARRVVSLNPVTTELIFALGAGDRLVGRTHWDLYPAAAARVPDVGNGMMPNVEAVLGQRPDLVILYGSESNRTAAAQLARAGVRTITFRTDHVADLARITPVIAEALGVSGAGAVVVDSVLASLAAVRALPAPRRVVRAYWHVWDAPLLTIGRESYLTELLTAAGAENVFGDLPSPSPQVSLEEIARRDPDVILVGPNSAAKLRAHPGWAAVRAVREGRVLVVDTMLVGRPGVRMGEAARHLRGLLYPEGAK